jgi:plastocyanin
MNNHFDKSVALRTTLIISLFLIVVFITGFGVSCQSQEPVPPAPSPGLPKEPTLGEPPATPPQIEVAIEGFAYKPATLNIQVGTTVIWYNKDSVPHTVTARDKSFDSGSLSRDGSFSFTFKQKGTFEYYCTIHPYMEGKVVVD